MERKDRFDWDLGRMAQNHCYNDQGDGEGAEARKRGTDTAFGAKTIATCLFCNLYFPLKTAVPGT